MVLDESNRIFVERGASDSYTGRGAKPVKDPGPALPFALLRVDDEGVLVAALVAAEPELRQNYFLFCVLAAEAGVFFAGALALAFAAGVFAFAAAGLVLAAVVAAAVRLASATWER